MNPMVEFRNVTKRWGTFTAVDNVSLTINAGEFLTLLGPSGCGKTTLLRMIGGFETPTVGSVLLDGQDVTFTPPYRRQVNQVFQSYALFPHLSVRDNIAFGLKMKKVPRNEISKRVDEVVAMVALAGMEDRKPTQLSGGQRQRVALARAIVNRPKVLLLDEPLSALDAKLRHSMQVELKRLQSKIGITFVFVTHDQEEALTMSDRIAVINRGRIEQLGPVEEIYHRPKTTFVANFIGEANIIDAEIVSRGGRNMHVRLQGGLELEVSAEDFAADVTKALVSIRPEKINITKDNPGGGNVFQATVIEELFKGATDELSVTTQGGLELQICVANEGKMEEAIHAGDQIWCQVHPQDAVLIESGD